MFQESSCASLDAMASADVMGVEMLSPFLAESFFGGTFMSYILMMAALVGVMYFLVIRPQNKKLRLHQEMLSSLRRGDKIVLNGGIIGKIHRLDDSPECIVEITEGVKVRVVKQQIGARHVSQGVKPSAEKIPVSSS